MTPAASAPFSLCLFVDPPVPGAALRHLQPPLTPDEAARLYLAGIDDLLVATRQLPGVTRTLYVYGEPDEPSLAALAHREGIALARQEGSDPGKRKATALERELGLGKRAVALLSATAPTLPPAFIAEAFDRLEGACQTVVGPTGGGGWYLLGVSRVVRADLLRNLGWGGRRVLADVLTRLAAQGSPSGLLPFWYELLVPEDLSLLRGHLALLARDEEDPAPSTRAALATLGRAAWG